MELVSLWMSPPAQTHAHVDIQCKHKHMDHTHRERWGEGERGEEGKEGEEHGEEVALRRSLGET